MVVLQTSMKKAFIILVLLSLGFYSNAQKVKYKDLYVLLRAKNYKDGASFLKTYIVANPEHPNANYQMGLMLENKISDLDLLKEADKIVARVDSAILYFDKAYVLITPKEVKKHDDDYYEIFKRRNLRTGKFEVILSDVQLDIENRKNELQIKKADIGLINKKFNGAINSYNEAMARYKLLRDNYKNELSLSMGATDTSIMLINEIVIFYDSAFSDFSAYKKLKESFESSSVKVITSAKPIVDFSKQALTTPEFYSLNVNFYNFSDWGKIQLASIEKQFLLLKHLANFNKSLDEIAIKITTDSSDLSHEVFKMITNPSFKELKLIDDESLAIIVFEYKISQLNYNSTLMSWYSQYADTLDVGTQLQVVEKLKNQLDDMKKLDVELKKADKDIFKLRYSKLAKASYGTMDSLFSYIESQGAVIKKEEEVVLAIEATLVEKDKWGYWHEDTLSLQLQTDPLMKYNTFYSDSLENRAVRIAGLTKIKNKRKLFFGVVPSSRIIDSLFYLDTTIKLADLNSSEFIVQAQNSIMNHTLYLIGVPKNGKYTLVLVNMHQINGIGWHMAIKLDGTLPPQLNFLDHYVLITQGEKVYKYQVSDGKQVKE